MIIANMSFDVSSQHLAMVDEERKLHQHVPAAPEKVASQMPALQSTWGPQNTSTDPVGRKQTKAKVERALAEELAGLTLPAPSSQQDGPMLQDPASQEPPAPRIPVKGESLSVFNKMFSSGGTTSIRWINLV